MAKIKTSISLEEELYEKLQKMSEVSERSISQEIAFLIKNAPPVKK